MELNGGLADLLSRVRRRSWCNILLDAAITALSVALGGLILLLALGTEIFAWQWPLVLLGLGLAAGVWRGRKRLLSPYRLLQEVDRRLKLHDGLSTAFIFAQPEHAGRASECVRAAQRAEAEALSRRIDPRRAAPLEAPRSLYLAVLLATAAGTLLAARYGVQHSLDLRPPLSRALADLFRWPAQAARLEQPEPPPAPPELTEAAPLPQTRQTARAEQPADPANGISPHGDSNPARNTDPALDTAQDRTGSSAPQDPETSQSADDRSGAEQAPPTPPASESGSGESGPPPPPREESDLIRKLQDAFANLLAKLKIPPMAGEGRRSSERRTSEGTRDEQGDGRRSREAAGNPDGEGRPAADPRAERAGDAARQAQAGKGEGADQRSDQPGSDQAQSGIGTKDGDKSLKAQEQLEAMGKLTEILGKRAENITGEVMIEVSSGDQSLQTPYVDRRARHGEAGGEIHRDQVPLIYHEYVQRYFEQVRKSAGR